MRSGINTGIIAATVIVTLALTLQGCGRKAPLTLSSSKARVSSSQASQGAASQVPAANPQSPEPQKTAEPIKLQGNEP